MEDKSTSERDFEDVLENFRRDIDIGISALYTMLTILWKASIDKTILNRINGTPYFWNTVLGSLQTTQLMALARIFDQSSKYNVDGVIRISQKNMCIFERSVLKNRKIGLGISSINWDEYIQVAYEPTPKDFRQFRKHVDIWRRKYEKWGLDDLRNKIFGHREWSETEIATHLKGTKVRRIKILFIALSSLYQALRGLYDNGHEPILKRQPCSIKKLLQNETGEDPSNGTTFQQIIVNETKLFLEKILKKDSIAST